MLELGDGAGLYEPTSDSKPIGKTTLSYDDETIKGTIYVDTVALTTAQKPVSHLLYLRIFKFLTFSCVKLASFPIVTTTELDANKKVNGNGVMGLSIAQVKYVDSDPDIPPLIPSLFSAMDPPISAGQRKFTFLPKANGDVIFTLGGDNPDQSLDGMVMSDVTAGVSTFPAPVTFTSSK